MAPKPPMPDAPPANPAQAAQRASSLEQTPIEEDLMLKTARTLREQQQVLNTQMELMRTSAEKRMNPVFDPALMAAAAGFSRPTKTGGFGESLGYAMENYAAETEKELARKQANDKIMLERLQQQQKMQNQSLLFESELRRAGYSPEEITTLSTGPSKGVAPSAGSPAGGAPAGSSPAEGSAPADGAQRQRKRITQQDIDIAMMLDPEGAGKRLLEQAKFERDRFLSTPQGLVNRDTGLAHDTGLEVSFEKSIPYLDIQKITQTQNREIEVLKKKYPIGASGRENAFAEYYSKEGFGGVTYKPAVEGKPAESSMKTAAQRKLEDEAASKTQEARIKESEARGNALIDFGQKADKIKQIALDMTSYADNNKRAFNLMQDTTFVDSLKRSIEKNGGIFFVDPRTIEQYKLTRTDLETLQMFNQKSAQLTTEMRKASRAPGEGATDKKEGELYAAVEALPTDTARVIILKSELLILRSDFDRMAAERWVEWRDDNPGKSFDKFRLASKEYKELRNGYEDALDKIRKANAQMLGTNSPSQRQESSPQSSPPAASGNRGDTRVIDGYIWERDAKGGWNNTGRKAK